MDLEGRLRSLADRHADLERQIAAENAALHPDELRVAAMKKEKLHTKDEMFSLQRELHTDASVAAH